MDLENTNQMQIGKNKNQDIIILLVKELVLIYIIQKIDILKFFYFQYLIILNNNTFNTFNNFKTF